MHIERILSALCLWTVGKCLVELGEETAGLSPPGHNTCWEKSNSPIRGLFSVLCFRIFLHLQLYFTTSWCTSFCLPLTLLSKALQSSQVLPPQLYPLRVDLLHSLKYSPQFHDTNVIIYFLKSVLLFLTATSSFLEEEAHFLEFNLLPASKLSPLFLQLS